MTAATLILLLCKFLIHLHQLGSTFTLGIELAPEAVSRHDSLIVSLMSLVEFGGAWSTRRIFMIARSTLYKRDYGSYLHIARLRARNDCRHELGRRSTHIVLSLWQRSACLHSVQPPVFLFIPTSRTRPVIGLVAVI